MKKTKKPLLIGAAALVLVGVLANPGCTTVRHIGWKEADGQHYYYNNKGEMVTGWLHRDDGSYYLLDNGRRASGWQEIDDARYYFDGDGLMVTGWAVIEGMSHYFDQQGSPVTGLVEIDGKTYGFGLDGALLSGWQEFDGAACYLGTDGRPYNGWLDDSGHTYYFRNGAYVTGVLALEDRNYFFDSQGRSILMVNPWNIMPRGYETELVEIGSGHYIAQAAAPDFDEMFQAMEQAGLAPIITSSYRTVQRQQEIFNERMAGYISQGMTEEEAYAETATSVAIPGTSEHQLGLAIDMSDATYIYLDEGQMETATQLWLIEHSWEYGFILRYPNGKSQITGIIYEPWHYRYVGRELAAELHELGLTMEEYLDSLTQDQTLTASNPENGNTMQ